jgi:hypothetical protein
MRELLALDADPSERLAFRSGDLTDLWLTQYPDLFSPQDLQIAKNQPQYHYFEWRAAIELRNRFGYLSLVEKYQYPSHKDKHAIFLAMVPPPVVDFLAWPPPKPQAPDLFCFKEDRTSWFFCEVKGPSDRRRPAQDNFFSQLEALVANEILFVRFRNRHGVRHGV